MALTAAFSLVLALPVVPVGSLHDSPVADVNEDAIETVGWPELVRQVADVHASLPAADRATAVIFTGNYGEAGAIDRFGAAYGLPRVYSGHNAYARFGLPPDAAAPVVVIGYRDPGAFAGCRPVAVVDNGVDLENEEQGGTIFVCAPLAAVERALALAPPPRCVVPKQCVPSSARPGETMLRAWAGGPRFSFVLALVVGLLTLVVIAPLALYGALARCDESCDQGPGWTHSRDASQWNAMSALALSAVVLAVTLPVLIAKRRVRAARLAAGAPRARRKGRCSSRTGAGDGRSPTAQRRDAPPPGHVRPGGGAPADSRPSGCRRAAGAVAELNDLGRPVVSAGAGARRLPDG